MDCPIVECKLRVEGASRIYRLQMDWAAINLAEQTTGKNYLDPQTWQSLSGTTLTAIFWAAAKQTQPDLVYGEVLKLGFGQARAMIDACNEAWRRSNEIAEEPETPINGLAPQTTSRSV